MEAVAEAAADEVSRVEAEVEQEPEDSLPEAAAEPVEPESEPDEPSRPQGQLPFGADGDGPVIGGPAS